MNASPREMQFEETSETEGARSATGVTDDEAPWTPGTTRQVPNAEVPAKAQRRKFTTEYKLRIVREAERLVVRNGRARARRVTLGCGTVEVEAPRVNERRVVDGQRARFTSELLPPYMRRSPKVAEVLPVLYLRGLSTGDFEPALKSLLGKQASGLSATSITRLIAEWKIEYEAFRRRRVLSLRHSSQVPQKTAVGVSWSK